jgi:glyoxylase-like metal-dependent hydrolase (beta-lactamase superfamily II)
MLLPPSNPFPAPTPDLVVAGAPPRRRAPVRTLHAALLVAFAFALPAPDARATAAAEGTSTAALPGTAATTFQEIAPGVHLLRGAFVPGQQPDGNTVVLAAPDGLVVVDTGRHAAHTQRILDFAAAAGKPIRAIVNTHWHLDHVSGNAAIRRQVPTVEVHASEAIHGALAGFLANSRRQLEQMLADPALDPQQAQAFREEVARIDSGPALAPTHPVTTAGPRSLAGRELFLGLTDHVATAADVWLFDPVSRVLVAGDLVTFPVPFLDTGCPAHWDAALASLLATDFTLLVPGHGPPLTRAEVATYRRAFANLDRCATTPASAEATCIDAWLADLGALLPAAEHAFTRQLLAYYLEVHLRAEPARRNQSCGAAAVPSPPAS